jgi:predicted Zn-dependent peptidase
MTLNGTGTAYISAIFDQSNNEQVQNAIIQELDKFANEGPTQEELNKIKINIKSDWLFDLQTFNEQASLIGFWKMFNHLEVFEKYLENIEKVTAEDVKNFIKKYYSKEKLSKVVVFPK